MIFNAINKGLSVETLKALRRRHLVPCIKTIYNEPILIHRGRMQYLFDDKGKQVWSNIFNNFLTSNQLFNSLLLLSASIWIYLVEL